MKKLRFHLEPRAYGRRLALHILLDDGRSDYLSVAQPVVFEMSKEETDFAPTVPCFEFEKGAAQELMDELWRCGIRPSEGQGSAGQLAAVQAHLNDMRRLVFDAPRHLLLDTGPTDEPHPNTIVVHRP